MKIALFLVGTLAASSLLPSVSQAAPAPGRKLPGPSAVQAARLKKSPPPNYLAHYLPDDRYKIAGGVWKYVSTDLDTYYHIPSSPNMLRQSASRVIGFANARDAEEAGYVADPTDGTARRAAPVTVPDGLGTDAEQTYVARITAILRNSLRDEAAWLAKMQGNTANATSVTPATRQIMDEAVQMMRKYSAQVSALRPPKRYARFQSLLLATERQGIQAINNISKSMNQGTFSMGSIDFSKMMSTQMELTKEARRVGIDPQLVR